MTTQRGFTLIEMAIVLVIITILIGGLAVPLSAQIQARRIAETRQILEEARDSVIGFAINNMEAVDDDSEPLTPDKNRTYLPCPDTELDGIVDGTEDRDGEDKCLGNEGWFPWVTLGTASQDAWGNRLRYRVTDTSYAYKSGFFNTVDDGDIQICNDGSCVDKVAENVPMVLVSHGPNSRGGRSSSLAKDVATPPPPAGTSADELNNTNGDAGFISRTPSKADHPSGEFDDLVVWISKSLLIARVRL